jgi:Tol biopolymer transport system component
MRKHNVVTGIAIVVCAVAFMHCGDDGDGVTPPPDDTESPAAVSDLACVDSSSSSITLSWTAPGDDDDEGTASSYDIRYAADSITTDDWDNATEVSNPPDPQEAGTTETFEVTGLAHTTKYFFALKASDDASNESEISNSPDMTTAEPERVRPARVTDMLVTGTSTTSISLRWTATGDDSLLGTASAYDIRYDGSPIDDANFDAATQVSNPPTPGPPGTVENFEVTGLNSNTRYYVALKVGDEVPNWSAVSTLADTLTDVPDLFRVTAHAARDQIAAWSPDGSLIAYTSDQYGGQDILVISERGGSPTRVTSLAGSEQRATWSPDGDQIAFQNDSAGEWDIWIVPFDIRTMTPGTPANLTLGYTGPCESPAWANNSNTIAFSRQPPGDDRHIWTILSDGTDITQVTLSGEADDNPTWSPNDDWVAYRTRRNPGDPWKIYRKELGVIDPPEQLTWGGMDDKYPAWSPDGGRYIAYMANPGAGIQDIYVIDLQNIGQGPVRITADDGFHDEIPSWSPRGDRIAYTHRESGAVDIYTIKYVP